jgi:hypothetical protein
VSTILDTVLAAHGGERWKDVRTISAVRAFGGALWGLKQVAGVAEHGRFTIDVQREHTSLAGFGGEDLRTDFTPERVAILRGDEVVEELRDPRSSFAGHELTTPWSRLELAYFTGYAMWTYNSEPWSFTFPGVEVGEPEPWDEDGEAWTRFTVSYPDSLATHSPVQRLYADRDGVLRRRDYRVDVAGGSPAVEYMTGQVEVGGLLLSTDREIYVRDAQDRPLRDTLIVSIRIDDVELG